ncbi:hypothetical protein ACFE04_030691 [Oxalis oulophora]
MDLLHKDEQRHKSGKHIRTDILALLSNIKNCVHRVGFTEDTTNALIANALHLTNCYACIPRWGIGNFVICSLMRLTVAESGKVVALILILKCHPYSVAPFMLQILLLLCKNKCHIIIHIHMPERTSAMQEQMPHHHSYTHARKDETFLVRWLKEIALENKMDRCNEFQNKWNTMTAILAKLPQKQVFFIDVNIIETGNNDEDLEKRLQKAEAHIEAARLLAFYQCFGSAKIASSSFLLVCSTSVLGMLAVALACAQKQRAITSGSPKDRQHAYVQGGRGFVCPASR